jgi:hypothetical protein
MRKRLSSYPEPLVTCFRPPIRSFFLLDLLLPVARRSRFSSPVLCRHGQPTFVERPAHKRPRPCPTCAQGRHAFPPRAHPQIRHADPLTPSSHPAACFSNELISLTLHLAFTIVVRRAHLRDDARPRLPRLHERPSQAPGQRQAPPFPVPRLCHARLLLHLRRRRVSGLVRAFLGYVTTAETKGACPYPATRGGSGSGGTARSYSPRLRVSS